MESQAPGIDERLGHLEAQIDRLSQALEHWRDAPDHLPPMERRLEQLTDQCADVLKQWAATGERHARAVGELEARLTGWNDVETRLQRDAAWRFQALERAIENEWAALRHMHEEPARQLRAHAESLTEVCVATAGSAQTGLERAEARLAALERDLHRRMDDLARDLHAAVAELRHRPDGAPLGTTPTSWSLDEVTRLHQELRDGSAARGSLPPGNEPDVLDSSSAGLAPRQASSLVGATSRITVEYPAESASAADDASVVGAPPPAPRSNGRWYAVLIVAALGLAVSIGLSMTFYRRADVAAARASEAQQHAEQIAAAADQRIEAARQDAATKIAQARETASKAQVTSDVLAAPDLVRFNLSGGDPAARISAQLLWSRSRGMVFSGSRLPALAPGTTYQIWLLTAEAPISAGTFVPDAAGRVTAAAETLSNVPRPITGVRVTLEPEPGRAQPSGTTVLTRAQ
jgi:hypothetical protein